MPEALSIIDKQKKQEIIETVEGNYLKVLSFAWVFSQCGLEMNRSVLCLVMSEEHTSSYSVLNTVTSCLGC